MIGAHNTGRLSVRFFESKDWQATREYFEPHSVEWNKADWDAELTAVVHDGEPNGFAARLLHCVRNYIFNETEDRIPYIFHGVNSNSWAQSLIQAAGGLVKEDFVGLELSNAKRVPLIYFRAICPANRRPAVNQ